jgi:two-component system sensor histidine kinase/response regulator
VPVLAGIDTGAGLANVVGNAKLYARLLLRFAEEQRTCTDRIRRCLESGDDEQATRLSHTLKGVAGSLGVRAVATAAGALESACRNGVQGAQRAESLQHVDEALVPVLTAIEQWQVAQRSADIDLPVGGSVDLVPVLDRLQGLLESYDAEANEVIEELEHATAGGAREKEFRQLRKLVDEFEFDAALEIVAAIRAAL